MAQAVYLIGIAGPSGAGKTFLAAHLAHTLHANVLALDRYYRDLSHLPLRERAKANFDTPDSVEHELLIQHLNSLRNSEAVHFPLYDFAAHTRSTGVELMQSSEVLIIEGLFSLYWPALRELLQTRVYVDMHEKGCLERRTNRDVQQRGRTPDSVLQQFSTTVAPMAVRYVHQTIAYADVVVSGADPVEKSVALVLRHLKRQALSTPAVTPNV